MLTRASYIVPLFLLLACASPEEQARLQTAAAAWGPTDHVGWRVTGACGSMLEAVTAWPALRKLLNAKHYAFPPWREMQADDTAALDRLCGQRHALRMIPGRRADDAAAALLFGERHELVERPANLVGPRPLEHLGLQAYVIAR